MKKIYLHPLPLRIWHWANALMVVVLIITGIQIRIPGMASLRPQDPALWMHRYAGWAMVASWVFWLLYSLTTNNLSRHYAIRRRDFGGIFRQAKFYLISIFKGEENPFRPSPDAKFNPLQKLAYGSIMGIFAPVIGCHRDSLQRHTLFAQICSALEYRRDRECPPRDWRVCVCPLFNCPSLHGDPRSDGFFPHKGDDRGL